MATPAPTPAPEPEAAASSAPAISVNAFVSGSYSYNFNSPPPDMDGNRKNVLRVFDDTDQSMRVDVAELVFQHPVSDPGSVGFRIDLVAGSAIPRLSASAGLLGGADIDLQQAYVSWLAKGGSGFRLDAGKFVTHLGAEVIEGYDGYNDNYTRSFLFGYAIPFTHVGLKASMPFGDKVTGTLMLVNGWDVAIDNNDTPSLGGMVVITPTPQLQAYLCFITGREQATGDGMRTVVDGIVIVKPTDKLALTLDAVFGTEADAVGGTDSASWYGAALYVKNAFTDQFSATLRGEYFSDADGFRTGAGTELNLIGITATPAFAITPNLVVRADLRLDSASEDIYVNKDLEAKGTQFTAAINLLATL